MWLEDMNSLADLYPQGMLIQINERGTAENFILKCKERVCGCAQLEIMKQTYEILNKYIEKTKAYQKKFIIIYYHMQKEQDVHILDSNVQMYVCGAQKMH